MPLGVCLGDTLEVCWKEIAGGLGVAGAAVAMALISRLLGAFAGSDPPSRAGRGNDSARGEAIFAVRAAYALDHEGQGRPARPVELGVPLNGGYHQVA